MACPSVSICMLCVAGLSVCLFTGFVWPVYQSFYLHALCCWSISLSICRLCVASLSVFLLAGFVQPFYSEVHFCFQFQLLGLPPCVFTLYQKRAGKVWLTTSRTLLSHMPAMFMTSQTWSKRQHSLTSFHDIQTLSFDHKSTQNYHECLFWVLALH